MRGTGSASHELGIDAAESHARIESLIDRLPDAVNDAARDPGLSKVERRITGTIAGQIVEWSTTVRTNMERAGGA